MSSLIIPYNYLAGYENKGLICTRDGCTVVSLYYDLDENLLFDEDGFPVFNYWYYGITPACYHMFLHYKEYQIFEVKPSQFVELIYPEDDEEYYEIIRTPIKSSS